MRILHVNKFLYRRGGAESYMIELAAMQRARGHEVAFFGMRHPSNESQEYARYYPRYLEFGSRQQSPLDAVRVAGRLIWSTSAARGIRSVVDDFKPDIVHHHNIYHQLSPSVLAEVKRGGVPQVMTLHDFKVVCPNYKLLAGDAVCTACYDGHYRHAVAKRCVDGSLASSTMLAMESALHRALDAYRHVDVFIAPSEFLAEQMRLAERHADKTVVVSNFVDVRDRPAELERGGFLYAGRVIAGKGVATLIKAAALLPEDPRFDVTIAGDGPDRQALERMAPPRVRFVGHLDRSRVEQLMEQSIATVLPARSHENQPMSVLESFERATPVVTTPMGGLPELVHDGETGALVSPDDPLALAKTLAELGRDPARARAMGWRGRELVEARHGPDGHVAAIDDVYERASRAADSVAAGRR